MKISGALVAISIVVATPAAADDYAKFYQAAPAGSVALLPSQVPAELVSSSGDIQNDVLRMWERGFALLGYSSFNGTVRNPSKALKFAQKLKARYVVTAFSDVSENTGALPFVSPTTNTARTAGSVTSVDGYGGNATGSFSASTTATGSRTTYLPFTVRRADQLAAYFAPLERKGSGVYGRDLAAEERAAIGTNHALYVLAVREGSPAFYADMLPGDIILSINGDRLTLAGWTAVMRGPAGSKVRVGLRRHGEDKTLTVVIPERWN